ncbi:MAG: lysophospholipid acyltransferase family protein [Chloroflexota bacterium]
MTVEAGFHKANKNAPGEWIVQRLLIKPSLRRAFGGIYAAIDPAALRLRKPAPYPVIFCMTHSGWYDGYIASVLNERVFHHDDYLMMEEANLARYFFFTWMGVFGVDRENVRSALASIEYISEVLSEGENRSLFMFPQGTMRHPDARPIKLYSGIATIARKVGKCAIVPMAIRYDFLMEQAPDAFVRLGAPVMVDTDKRPVNARELTNHLTDVLTKTADRLHADISAYNREPYRLVMSGRGSINKTWDGILKIVGKAKRALSGVRG